MKLHLKPKELLTRKEPAELGLEYTSVQRIEVNGSVTIDSKEEELCFVVLTDKVDFDCNGRTGTALFKDMIYVPRNASVTFSGNAVLMQHGAPAHIDTEFAHVKFADVDKGEDTHATYGKTDNNTLREVWHYLNDSFNASRLMMGICQGKIGGWTSWPPHEHAEQREEVYTYFDMGEAFGIQCVYEDMDNPLVVAMVRDGDLVSVPKGYHPNVGCPAMRISFIYCMVAKTPGERKFMDLKIQEIFGDKFE